MTDTPTPTSDDKFDALLSAASLPERAVRICLDGRLRAEYEQLKAAVAARTVRRAVGGSDGEDPDVRLSTPDPAEGDGGDGPEPDADLLAELAEQVRARSVTILLRALSSADYNRLLEQHPPRRDRTTGHIDARDYAGFNSSSFPSALVRACIVSPTMTDERWQALDKVLTDAQFDRLWRVAAELNRRDEDIPF